MSIRTTMNKQKLMVDDIITIVLVVILLLLALGFRVFLLMSLIVYPMGSLLIYGIGGTYKGIFNKKMNSRKKVLTFILGIGYILFAIFMFTLLFTPPRIPITYIIYFLSIPVFLIGIGGVLKGSLVDVYSPLLRLLNVLIGATTVIFTGISVIFAETSFTFHLVTLLTTLTLNGILRSALYLSEYELSLKSIRNLKLVWFLMDNIPLHQLEEN